MRRVTATKAGLLAATALLLVSVMFGGIPFTHGAAPSHATGQTALKSAVTYTWHTITFTEAGLPPTAPGLFWAVNVKEMGYALGNNSPAIIVWSLNATSNGTAGNHWGNYTYSVDSVQGYDIKSITSATCGASATTNYCNITTANASVLVTFNAMPQYDIQFNETGLTAGTSWSVTFNGGTLFNLAPGSIVFADTNGTYAWSTATSAAATSALPPSGTLSAPGVPCSSPSAATSGGCTTAAGVTYQNITFIPTPAPTGVAVTFPTGAFSTNGLPYFALPVNVTWNVTVTNAALSATTTSQTLTFIWLQSGCGPFTFPCPVIWSTSVPFAWEQRGATATQAGFYYPVNAANLTSSTYLGYGLPQGQWQILVTTSVTNPSNPTSSATAVGSTVQAAFIAIVGPNGVFTAPSGNVTEGIVSITGNYSGYFVTSANVTVFNSSGSTVLIESVYGPSVTTNPFSIAWHANVPGAFKIVLTLVAAWHLSTLVSEIVNVVPAIPLTYVNNTGLNIANLGAGGSAALLITLGAVIGMIVMALVSRGIMGGGSKPGPAQAWSPQSSQSGSTSGGTGGGSMGGSGGSGGMSDSGSGMSGQNPPG